MDKVIDAAAAGLPLTKRQLLVRVGILVKKLGLKTQFKKGIPGDDYRRALKSRRPDLMIRKPEGCATNRMRGMNPVVVDHYFQDLDALITSLDLAAKPERIRNADETGLQFSPEPDRANGKKGMRGFVARTSNSRESITTLVCVNAAGTAMPPLCVVKGKTMHSVQSFATQDAPQGTVWTYQPNAWMGEALGIEWFREVFLKNCRGAPTTSYSRLTWEP
ncbi:jerky protein [Elysia marginata]|uniref:Jerky protein n=1 Tax=Elysia marginata TaxID=1093978 RepID=A0AAV4I4T1_9GAST|nr:jerky protein [Elysia marginata]